ncbi:hypothetical protein HF319_00600 [Xanthomonas sp. Kuri4-1]
MKNFIPSFGAVVLAIVPLASIAENPRAAASAEKQLWSFSERIALALPGDGRDVLKIASVSSDSVATPLGLEHRGVHKEIAPSLVVSNIVVVTTSDNHADSVSFDVTESCIPLASLRNQYPSLIVMDYARADSEHATYTLGAQVGDAIVAYSFPANRLNCMSRVAVTPAKVTKSKLGIGNQKK